jgi:UDP-N-acetylglucosamine 2-epimerase (non-hydrolysing)
MVTTLSIIGTRPEAIKMAPVIRELSQHGGRVKSLVVATGQHREMLDQVMRLFGIRADYDLGLMRPKQSLSSLTAALFEGLDRVVDKTQPDWILAQGDTTTVMVASLVAFYHRVRFGHVEAGLRTGDKWRPFPEEVNRRIADIIADAYFVPTQRAKQTLLREGCPATAIHVTGNTVIDAMLEVAGRPFDWSHSPLADIPGASRLVLVTAHRRESFGAPFREVCQAIRDLASKFADQGVHFVYPVHLNPNVREPVYQILSGLNNVSLIEPLPYLDLVHLMKRCTLILTDSGGIQEEAPSLRVPVLVMRETTERPEGVEAGVCKLVGTTKEKIVRAATRILRSPKAHAAMATGRNPYGDGQSAKRILSAILADRRNR